jgi:hypothetical protein
MEHTNHTDTEEQARPEPEPRPVDPLGNPIYRIPECNIEQLKARVGKMNKRAAKLKMDPLVLSEIGEEFEEQNRREGNGHKVKVTVRFVLVTLTGNCPRVNGWAMAATIQHDEGGNILRTVPGFETTLPAIYRTRGTHCDHCSTDRRRNDTYVLHGETRHVALNAAVPEVVETIWKQVGRNCLADFLRTENAAGLAEYAEMLAGLDEEMSEYEDEESFGGGRQREYFSALRLLTQVACCVRAGGWCSRTEAKNSFVPKLATVDEALSCWNSIIWNKLSAADQIRLTPTDEDEKRAADAIAWAQELPADVGNDYLWNIRVVSHREQLSHREAGLAGSIISAYNRHMEQELARKYEREHPSEFFGEVGKREVFTLTVSGLRDMQSDFGSLTLVSFVDPNGNKGKWFASNAAGFDLDKTFQVKATVKKHELYTREIASESGASDAATHSTKQTMLTRCVIYDAAAEAQAKAALKAARKATKGKYVCPHLETPNLPLGNFAIPELEGLTKYTEYIQCCYDCQRAWVARYESEQAVAA